MYFTFDKNCKLLEIPVLKKIFTNSIYNIYKLPIMFNEHDEIFLSQQHKKYNLTPPYIILSIFPSNKQLTQTREIVEVWNSSM